VTTKAWLRHDHELVPGAEIFCSDRRFNLEAYSASHGQLLLRSNPTDDEFVTTIDVLFKPVEALKMRDGYGGLVIRCARPEEAEGVISSVPGIDLAGYHVFLLESEDRTDYVISMAVGWQEGILARTQGSFFNSADAYLPRWPTGALFGINPGFNAASIHDLIDILASNEDDLTRRERFRYIFVLMADLGNASSREPSGVGAFLTEADAEEARGLFVQKVARCWVEAIPITL
jgi:hypothetical protein